MLHLLTLMLYSGSSTKCVSDLCAWHQWQMRATICALRVLIQWHAGLFQSPLIYFTGSAPFTYVSYSSDQHTMSPPVACMNVCVCVRVWPDEIRVLMMTRKWSSGIWASVRSRIVGMFFTPVFKYSPAKSAWKNAWEIAENTYNIEESTTGLQKQFELWHTG